MAKRTSSTKQCLETNARLPVPNVGKIRHSTRFERCKQYQPPLSRDETTRRGFLQGSAAALVGASLATTFGTSSAARAANGEATRAGQVEWRRHKAVVLESDDWGGCGVLESPDLEAYRRMTQVPAIRNALMAAGDSLWPWMNHTLETPDKMARLFDFLLKFKGADGRPAVFTPVYLAANPDCDAIRANGFRQYVDIGICDGFPSRWDPARWNHAEITAKAKEGISLGVWHPQTHGRNHHYSGKKWVRSLRENADGALTAFFELGMVGVPLDKERSGEVKGLEFDDMTDKQLDEWFQTGLGYFRRAFGYESPCAPMVNAVWAKKREPDLEQRCEQMLSRAGIKFCSHSYKARKDLGGFGMGHYDEALDLTFLAPNAYLDPLGKPDSEAKRGVTACYQGIQEAWARGEPAVVTTHRINYVSLDPEQERQGYTQLERLLNTLHSEHPEVVFLTSWEVGQLYRKGWSSVRYGQDIVCRNYSGGKCELSAPLESGESVSEVVSLPDGRTCEYRTEEGKLLFAAQEGDYLVRIANKKTDC